MINIIIILIIIVSFVSFSLFHIFILSVCFLFSLVFSPLSLTLFTFSVCVSFSVSSSRSLSTVSLYSFLTFLILLGSLSLSSDFFSFPLLLSFCVPLALLPSLSGSDVPFSCLGFSTTSIRVFRGYSTGFSLVRHCFPFFLWDALAWSGFSVCPVLPFFIGFW